MRSANGFPLSEASIWSVERETELLGHFVLPLLDEAAGRNDQAPFEIAADQQLLDEEARHDRLASAGVVGEQEAQWLAWKHLAIDGGDLMRQRLDLRRRDRDVGVEEISQTNAVRLGREAQQSAVGVEPIGSARLYEFKADLLAPHDEPLVDAAVDTKYDVERIRAELGDLHNLCEARGIEAAKAGAGSNVFKRQQGCCPVIVLFCRRLTTIRAGLLLPQTEAGETTDTDPIGGIIYPGIGRPTPTTKTDRLSLAQIGA